MKFSIITPVLNRREKIETMFNSVKNQNFKDFELLIVDNGSTDGTYEYCKILEKKFHYVKVFLCKERGAAFARNVAIKIAIGEWVVLLDSDNKFINNDTLNEINNIINKYIKETTLGIWTKSKTSLNTECSFVNTKYKDTAVDFNEYLNNVSGEFAPVINTKWFKNNLFPQIQGAVAEFPNMVWFQLLRDGNIYISTIYTQVYSIDSDGRICSSTSTTKERALELTHYYFMLTKKFSDELIENDKFNEFIFKFHAYNAISGEFESNYLDNHKYLSWKNKLLIPILYILPKSFIKFSIQKYKEKTLLK